MKTYLTLVVDRSNSMGNIREKAQSGINSLLTEQKSIKMNGKMGFTLVDFDDKIEVVQSVKDVKEAKEYQLIPRGWTALWDAIQFAVDTTKAEIAKLRRRDQPKVIMCVVVTDGQDNKSKLRSGDIQSLVSELKANGWDFTFLCNNPLVLDEGVKTGMNSAQYSDQQTHAVYNAISQKVIRTRNSLVSSNFTANELTSMR